MKTLWNDGFTFMKLSVDADLTAANAQADRYEPVEIPHDFLIFDAENLYENATGWYRKRFPWHRSDGSVLLTFDGVYMDSTIYVNQQEAGEWKYGYSSFSVNVTPYLQDGENELIVRVCHQSPNSRWYSGAGIYRNVWMRLMKESHIEENGIYVHTERCGDGREPDGRTEDAGEDAPKGLHHFKMTVDTDFHGGGTVTHRLFLRENGEETVLDLQEQTAQKTVSGHIGGCSATGEMRRDAMTDRQVFLVQAPRIWDIRHPVLYELVTTLTGEDDIVQDEQRTTVGFRTIRIDPDTGFWLNGRNLKLNGACEHHDLGAMGAAFNRAAQARKYRLLMGMGVNAIRFSHNMPAPECLELCDEMGLLVMDESFDMWERPKTQYDYARFFDEWCGRDMESFIRRDRNHPSVMLWSIGNEIYDTHADAVRGKEMAARLKGMVKRFDPLGNAPVTFASNYLAWENSQPSADILDAVGYNYTEKCYREHHKMYPKRVIFGSETASIVYSRGVYHFPLAATILSDDDEQCSALGNSISSWGAKSPETCICQDRDMEFSLGQFIWTGTDYIGEPTPYHTKNSYFGQIDTAGFPKDSYYIFQSAWTDYRTSPMIHIFPYWDFNEGQMIDVRVCSNAPDVELFLNGVSLGRQHLTHKPGEGNNIIADYRIPYETGVLEAAAYDDSGDVVCREEKHSFSDAVKLVLQADRTVLEDENDISFVTISAVDCNGHPVENATNRVFADVKGAGRLVGLDNGDSTDYDSYKGVSRCLFGGKLLAMVMPDGEGGELEISVQGKNLEPAVLKMHSNVVCTKGLHKTKNRERRIYLGTKDTIHVRKLAVTCQAENDPDGKFKADRTVTPECGEIALAVQILPEDATDRQVVWQAVNDTGVMTNLVKLIPSDGEGTAGAPEIVCSGECGIRVSPLGDGPFRIRCMSKSGTDSFRIISELEFRAQGFGTAFLDPYTLVSGSLFSRSNGMEGAGNEKGVATGSGGPTVLTYDYLDFGDTYADELTMPIFALNDEAYEIEIYEGTPEDGQIIGHVVYRKPSVWNVYQEETWKLDKRLHGVTSVSFVLQEKVHIKGFYFKKEEKAYLELRALDAEEIYGDTFTRTADAVERIGNNVSLVYRHMDFGGTGTKAIKICGRAHGAANTIHIRFSDGANEIKQIVEFPAEDDAAGTANAMAGDACRELEFPLTLVCGMQEVSFVFLPGSCFDFRSFRFIREKGEKHGI